MCQQNYKYPLTYLQHSGSDAPKLLTVAQNTDDTAVAIQAQLCRIKQKHLALVNKCLHCTNTDMTMKFSSVCKVTCKDFRKLLFQAEEHSQKNNHPIGTHARERHEDGAKMVFSADIFHIFLCNASYYCCCKPANRTLKKYKWKLSKAGYFRDISVKSNIAGKRAALGLSIQSGIHLDPHQRRTLSSQVSIRIPATRQLLIRKPISSSTFAKFQSWWYSNYHYPEQEREAETEWVRV